MREPDILHKIFQIRLGGIVIQFIKFGMVGMLNTGISLAIYYIFLVMDTRLYLIGNIIGFFFSTLNAYWFNHKFVFGKKDGKVLGKATLLKTYLAYAFSLAVSTGLLYIFVNCLKVSQSVAPLCCLLITVPMNYFVNKFWVYRPMGGVV